MRVDRLRHDKLRTVGRVGVEVLNGRIVKSAVGTAELHVKHTVACAAPVGIGVAVKPRTLTAVSATACYRHINGR